MTLDTFIALASLLVSIGGLFPVLYWNDSRKPVVLGVLISFLVLLSVVGSYRAVQHQSEIRYVSGEVMKTLGKSQSTIEQLEQSILHVNFTILSETLDNLVRSGKIQYEPMKLYDTQRNAYSVGIYFVPTLR